MIKFQGMEKSCVKSNNPRITRFVSRANDNRNYQSTKNLLDVTHNEIAKQ